MSAFKIRSIDQMNTHNNIKNPARVSCSTNPSSGVLSVLHRLPGPALPSTSAKSRYLTVVGAGQPSAASSPVGSVHADDDWSVLSDHITVGQLPPCTGALLTVVPLVDQVCEQCDLPVPIDLQ